MYCFCSFPSSFLRSAEQVRAQMPENAYELWDTWIIPPLGGGGGGGGTAIKYLWQNISKAYYMA